MFDKLCYFLRSIRYKFKKQECPSHVTVVNNLPEDKKKYVKCSISLCHCRGHDYIIIAFCFDKFFETRRRLFGDYHYWFDNSL